MDQSASRPGFDPHALFGPDPKRAIHVQGEIDQRTLDELTPRIVQLQAETREPITVYIDSPGGSVYHMEALLALLQASTRDCDPPCYLISVVTTLAASAAADLLVAGSYALAYPFSSILFHGERRQLPEALTMEQAAELAEHMGAGNKRYARELSARSGTRFILRYLMHFRPRLGEYRTHADRPSADDLECLCALIERELSEGARELLRSARGRCERYRRLLGRAVKRLGKVSERTHPLDFEAKVLKATVDFEAAEARGKRTWTFSQGGFGQLREDFFLMLDYLSIPDSSEFRDLCLRWGHFLLSDEEQESLTRVGDDEREARSFELAGPRLEGPWTLFAAICDVLQQGENLLTARDAFWLGLIDEVIGDPDLVPLRDLLEYQSTLTA